MIAIGREAKMLVQHPRCARCRVNIEPGQALLMRDDGRLEHATCPEVTCPVCTRTILPQTPIRRDGDEMVHANCYSRRLRATHGAP